MPVSNAMLKRNDVKHILQETLEPVLTPNGFRARGDCFVRSIADGNQQISIALYDYRPTFEFSASLGIRLEEVESFVAPFTGVLPEHRSLTLTSLTQLEHFGLKVEGGRGVLFRGDSHDTLCQAASRLADVLRLHAVPFLDRYRDLPSVEAGLNPPGAEGISSPIWPEDHSRFDGTNEPYRAMHGIATAYLVGNPKTLSLIHAYRGQLSGMVEEIRSKYESLAKHIEALTKSAKV